MAPKPSCHSRSVTKPLNEIDANYRIACNFRSLALSHMSPNRLSNLTIVVVEVHDDARRYLGLFLDRLGANFLVEKNGYEGLEAIKNNHPNVVVSEISMPGTDGVELLREIRALGPDAGGSVPVIAVTAYRTRARILNAGFQACLPKPFTPDKLLETILAVLND